MIITSRRIKVAKENFARIEVLIDGEWYGVTQFMAYEICKDYMKMMEI